MKDKLVFYTWMIYNIYYGDDDAETIRRIWKGYLESRKNPKFFYLWESEIRQLEELL